MVYTAGFWLVSATAAMSRFVRLRVWLTTDVKLLSHYMKGCVCAVCICCVFTEQLSQAGLD